MRRTVLAITATLLVMASAPLAAEDPFGSFGGLVTGGNAGGGVVGVHGWALDDDGVAAVDIFVDGRIVGRATYNLERPGVSAGWPGFPDSDAPGFSFRLDTTRFLNGNHTVEAMVTSAVGETTMLNSEVIEFTNLTHNLVPFGDIDWPNESAELLGNCDPFDLDRRYHSVMGWALDVGVETGDLGVGYVELLIDGAIFANSQTSCFIDPALGGLSNCYGLRRFNVARFFPDIRDSSLSGFRFVLDVGDLINFGYAPGRHTLTVRVGDISGQVANIDEMPVFFGCETPGNQGAFGQIWRPRNGLIHSGSITTQGWVLDRDGIDRVLVYVDNVVVGTATFGLARPAISLRYPGFPNTLGPGWEFTLDSADFSNGVHELQVIAFDLEGQSTLLGQREIVINN